MTKVSVVRAIVVEARIATKVSAIKAMVVEASRIIALTSVVPMAEVPKIVATLRMTMKAANEVLDKVGGMIAAIVV